MKSLNTVFMAISLLTSALTCKADTDTTFDEHQNVYTDPLHEAVISGNLPMAKELLDGEASPFRKDQRGRTYLFHAVSHGQMDIVKFLLKNYVGINAKDYKGRTCLFSAAAIGDSAMVKFLLEKNAYIHERDDEKQNCLLKAIRNGHKEVVQLLIDNGLDIYEKLREEETYLFPAVTSGNKDMVVFLLNKGLDIHAQNESQETCIFKAVAQNDKEMVLLLFQHGANLNVCNSSGETCLFKVALKGNKEMAQFLLEQGLTVHIKDKEKRTCLFPAILSGNRDLVEFLLEKGLDVNAQDRVGVTCLHEAIAYDSRLPNIPSLIRRGKYTLSTKDGLLDPDLLNAAQNGDQAAIKLLIKEGLFVKNKLGKRELITEEEDNTSMTKFLLKRGADINVRTHEEDTPLFKAVSHENQELVNLLLDKGANVFARDSKWRTCLFNAVSKKHKGIIQLLLDKGLDINIRDINGRTCLFEVNNLKEDKEGGLKTSVRDLVQFLISKGADIHSEDNNDYNCLDLAQDRLIAKLLIENGLRKSVSRNKDAYDCLFEAASTGKSTAKDQVEYLLAKGLDINANYCEKTCLFKAVERNLALNAELSRADLFEKHKYQFEKEYIEDIIHFLLSQGADINAKNTYTSETCLSIAVKQNDLAVVKLLISKGADVTITQDLLGLIKNKCYQIYDLAAQESSRKITQLLVKSGASTHDPDFLTLAVSISDKEMIECLLNQGIDVNTNNSAHGICLFEAVKNKNFDMVEFLLSKGADSNACDSLGQTCLMKSKSYDKEAKKIALFLIKNGALTKDPHFLFIAAYENDQEVAQLLLDQGFDINAREDKWDRTCLFEAVLYDNKDMVKFLLSKGADIHARNNQKRTPLFEAVKNKNFDMVEFLLSKGADSNACDSLGQTCLMKSKSYDKEAKKIALFLIKNGALTKDPHFLFIAASENDQEVAQLLLDQGFDMSARDEWDQTCLFEAVLYDNKDMVQFLLSKGADIHARNNQKRTPLFTAVYNSSIEMTKLLLHHGAHINDRDNRGDTCLDDIDKSISEFFLDKETKLAREKMKQFLIEHGAHKGN